CLVQVTCSLLCTSHLFLSLPPCLPRPPLFPYTTLFRSAPSWSAPPRPASCLAMPASPMARSPQRHLRASSPASGIRSRRMAWLRSEEHTSELQSHLNLVCRLLLEKKNKYQYSLHT